VVLHFLLARTLSLEYYGYFATISAWLTFALLAVTAGGDTLLTRNVAWSAALREPVRPLFRRLEGRSLRLSGAVIVCAVGFGIVAPEQISADARWMILLMFVGLPALVLANLHQALLRGAAQTIGALLPDNGIRPLAQLLVLGALLLVAGEVTGIGAAWAHLIGCLSAWAVAAIWTRPFVLRRATETADSTAMHEGEVPAGAWHEVQPFLLVAVATLVLRQTDLVLVGALLDASSAGLYGIAMRVADVCSLLIVVANVVLSPRIAEMYRAGRIEAARRLVQGSAWILFAICALTALVIAGEAVRVLSWFGASYVEATAVLRTLLLAQVIAVGLGPFGLWLSMTGRESVVARTLLWSAVAHVVLCAVGTLTFGIEGAAVATVISTLVWRGLLMYRSTLRPQS